MTPQQKFNEMYIDASEIRKRLGIGRSSVAGARKRGQLPDPIITGDKKVFLWERAMVEPLIKAWEDKRAYRQIVQGMKRSLKESEAIPA